MTVSDGSTFELQPSMVEVKLEEKKISSQNHARHRATTAHPRSKRPRVRLLTVSGVRGGVRCHVVRRCLLGLCVVCSAVKYIPSVIEPSFGIGRILYHVLEHSFRVRPEPSSASASASAAADAKLLRAFLSLPAHLAPVKVAVLPLSAQPQFAPLTARLLRHFTAHGLTARSDTSGSSIGRRYARCDEVGVPFAITVDFESLTDGAVTLRERDSTQQVRLPLKQAVDVVQRLCRERPAGGRAQADDGDDEDAIDSERSGQRALYATWSDVYAAFPQVIRSDADDS